MKSRVPLIIAIVLLLLPVLYFGSYLALVVPGGRYDENPTADPFHLGNYRMAPHICDRLYWPLEKIDRKLRPQAWIMRWRR